MNKMPRSKKQMASDFLKSVSKPDSVAFSQMQGMQNQLDNWATKFGPTDSTAIQPYDSDANLVACKLLHTLLCQCYFFFRLDDTAAKQSDCSSFLFKSRG
jgi:hypothetical protein